MGASRHIDRLARPIALDLVEKVAVSCLLGVLAARMIPVAITSGNILPILLVVWRRWWSSSSCCAEARITSH